MTEPETLIKTVSSNVSTVSYIELIIISNGSAGRNIQRDLFDISMFSDIRSIIRNKSLPENTQCYLRDYNLGTLVATDTLTKLHDRMSIIAVRPDVPLATLKASLYHIGIHREIIPTRVAV